jgi:hypothetical protein
MQTSDIPSARWSLRISNQSSTVSTALSYRLAAKSGERNDTGRRHASSRVVLRASAIRRSILGWADRYWPGQAPSEDRRPWVAMFSAAAMASF